MKAFRISSPASYSAENPPPSSSLQLVDDIPKPKVSQSGDVVVRVKATSVIRDNLTWPEMIAETPAYLGNDFAGIVTETYGGDDTFKVGDEVYGMTSASRGGTWAEYVLVKPDEAYIKPKELSWPEAAALPLSALTADQALFRHAGLSTKADKAQRILLTGASGGVGMFLVRFPCAAGHHIVAASSSNARNETYLRSLGAQEIVQYDQLDSVEPCDVIVDTVGGKVLRACWTAVKPEGALVSVDSSSWNFVEEHRAEGLNKGEDGVRASWFVVEPSRESMARISKAVVEDSVRGVVAREVPFQDGRTAYEIGHSRDLARGKVILIL